MFFPAAVPVTNPTTGQQVMNQNGTAPLNMFPSLHQFSQPTRNSRNLIQFEIIEVDSKGDTVLDEENKPEMLDLMLDDQGNVVLDGNGQPKTLNTGGAGDESSGCKCLIF